MQRADDWARSRGTADDFIFLSLRERIKVRAVSIQRARRFRKHATDAEKRLWSGRNRQVAGLKFRRQHALGNRVIDFYCHEAKLAIELDGSGHACSLQRERDLDREMELRERGIRTLRFDNSEILNNLDGVLNAIIHSIDPDRSLWRQT